MFCKAGNDNNCAYCGTPMFPYLRACPATGKSCLYQTSSTRRACECNQSGEAELRSCFLHGTAIPTLEEYQLFDYTEDLRPKDVTCCEVCPDREYVSGNIEEAWCVTLSRRPDRWASFREGVPESWPLPEVWPQQAIDGSRVPHPEWWKAGSGAWGCMKSHEAILQSCLNRGITGVAIFEDDADFVDGFGDKFLAFMKEVPSDWNWLFLGGQHMHVNRHPPERINEHVYRVHNVCRTHAYILRGKAINAVYEWITARNWHRGHHVDHHYGRLMESGPLNVYCPAAWLVAQGENDSDIDGDSHDQRFFRHAMEFGADPLDYENVKVKLVLGPSQSAVDAELDRCREKGEFVYTDALDELGQDIIPDGATRTRWGRAGIRRHVGQAIMRSRLQAITKEPAEVTLGHPVLCLLTPEDLPYESVVVDDGGLNVPRDKWLRTQLGASGWKIEEPVTNV